MIYKLAQYLIENHITISTMESLTGGLFASELTKISSISAVFKGGMVTYSDDVKIKVGKINPDVIARYGAISSECSVEMAKSAQRIFTTDVSVSFTGNAGPLAAEGKQVGEVYTCICYLDKIYPYRDLIKKERNELRNEIVYLTAERICKILIQEK